MPGPCGRGRLITVEGLDGAGKTTLVACLADALAGARPHGRRCCASRAAWRSPSASGTLVKDPALTIDPRAEALLYAAARAQLVAERLEPLLAGGRVGAARPLRGLLARLPGGRAPARDRGGPRAQPRSPPAASSPTARCCCGSTRRRGSRASRDAGRTSTASSARRPRSSSRSPPPTTSWPPRAGAHRRRRRRAGARPGARRRAAGARADALRQRRVPAAPRSVVASSMERRCRRMTRGLAAVVAAAHSVPRRPSRSSPRDPRPRRRPSRRPTRRAAVIDRVYRDFRSDGAIEPCRTARGASCGPSEGPMPAALVEQSPDFPAAVDAAIEARRDDRARSPAPARATTRTPPSPTPTPDPDPHAGADARADGGARAGLRRPRRAARLRRQRRQRRRRLLDRPGADADTLGRLAVAHAGADRGPARAAPSRCRRRRRRRRRRPPHAHPTTRTARACCSRARSSARRSRSRCSWRSCCSRSAASGGPRSAASVSLTPGARPASGPAGCGRTSADWVRFGR